MKQLFCKIYINDLQRFAAVTHFLCY